jgi:hypothetical protein
LSQHGPDSYPVSYVTALMFGVVVLYYRDWQQSFQSLVQTPLGS